MTRKDLAFTPRMGVVEDFGQERSRKLKANPKERRRRPTFKKNLAAGTPVSYVRICLNGQFKIQKSLLTTKPAWFIRNTIVAVKLAPQYVGF